jgi:F0F1-type ATP synthase delta subunit
MDKHLQLKEVLIFSSEKLPPKQQQVFKKHFSKNSKLAFYEDSSLLDGYRIYWDGKMLPLSTKDFLQNLKESIETLTP